MGGVLLLESNGCQSACVQRGVLGVLHRNQRTVTIGFVIGLTFGLLSIRPVKSISMWQAVRYECRHGA